MSLLARLRELGSRLGILQLAQPKSERAPAKVTMRTVSLAELQSEVMVAAIDGLAKAPIQLSATHADIFIAAGIAHPPKGWTIARLGSELRSPALAGRPKPEVQAEILERLQQDDVAVESVVRDAVARDQALDQFAATVHGTLSQRAHERERRRAAIAGEIERLHAEAARLDQDGRAEHDRWIAWWAEKLTAEREMAWALGHLLEKPIVTIDERAPDLGSRAKP